MRVITLKEQIGYLCGKHGHLRAVSLVTGIDHAYLYRLSTGFKDNPSPEVLEKLGLKKLVVYIAEDET